MREEGSQCYFKSRHMIKSSYQWAKLGEWRIFFLSYLLFLVGIFTVYAPKKYLPIMALRRRCDNVVKQARKLDSFLGFSVHSYFKWIKKNNDNW